MSEFFFQPPKPVASTRPSVVKTYVCQRCGEERPASEMNFTGLFMEVVRDKSKFECKAHQRQPISLADTNNPCFDGPESPKPISRSPLPNLDQENSGE